MDEQNDDYLLIVINWTNTPNMKGSLTLKVSLLSDHSLMKHYQLDKYIQLEGIFNSFSTTQQQCNEVTKKIHCCCIMKEKKILFKLIKTLRFVLRLSG